MKTILTALTSLLLTASTFTTATATETTASRYVIANKSVAESYNSIVVRGDVDVILVQGSSNLMTLEGYQNQLDNVKLTVSGQTLYVNTLTTVKGKKPVVYIPVSDLQRLTVKGNSNITTLGFLQAKNTVIELSNECHVALKSTGNISISQYSTNEYIIDKWEMAAL